MTTGMAGRCAWRLCRKAAEFTARSRGEAGADYHAEIPPQVHSLYEEYDLAIEGRADGIIYEEGLLEETSRFLEDPRMDLEEGQEEAKPFVMIDDQGCLSGCGADGRAERRASGTGKVLCLYFCDPACPTCHRRADDLLQFGYGGDPQISDALFL